MNEIAINGDGLEGTCTGALLEPRSRDSADVIDKDTLVAHARRDWASRRTR